MIQLPWNYEGGGFIPNTTHSYGTDHFNVISDVVGLFNLRKPYSELEFYNLNLVINWDLIILPIFYQKSAKKKQQKTHEH